MDEKMNGVYVVTRRDKDLVLKNFDGVLGREVAVKVLDMKNFPRGPQYDPDGIEMDLRPGALVKITRRPDLPKFGFHMANVGPNNEMTQLQYEYVLGKLGLGKLTKLSGAYLAAEGQFRKLCADIATGREMKN